MSESAPSTKTKKETTKSPATKKTEASSAATDSASTSTSDKTSDSTSDSGSESKPSTSSKGGASARPISYFSSVSTDDYRSGWDGVFGKNKTARRNSAKTRRGAAPATIELEMSDLDAGLRAELEAAFRRKARARRVNFDKSAKNWRLICEING